MQVLTKPCNSHYSTICDVAALVEDEISEAGCGLHDLLDARILQLAAVCEIEDTKGVVGCFLGQAEEGLIGDAPTVSQPQFPQVRTFGYKGGNGLILEIPTVMEVDLENITTVSGKGDDGLVGELGTAVEFELRASAIGSDKKNGGHFVPASDTCSSQRPLRATRL